jgi:hypothetical protein
MTRIALPAALLAALALATGFSPALGAPLATAPGALVLTTAPAGPSVVVSAAPVAELAQQEIFEILCGGMVPQDSALAEHLWKVAGSLARRGWTPPTVTVRSVVRASEPAPR